MKVIICAILSHTLHLALAMPGLFSWDEKIVINISLPNLCSSMEFLAKLERLDLGCNELEELVSLFKYLHIHYWCPVILIGMVECLVGVLVLVADPKYSLDFPIFNLSLLCFIAWHCRIISELEWIMAGWKPFEDITSSKRTLICYETFEDLSFWRSL